MWVCVLVSESSVMRCTCVSVKPPEDTVRITVYNQGERPWPQKQELHLCPYHLMHNYKEWKRGRTAWVPGWVNSMEPLLLAYVDRIWHLFGKVSPKIVASALADATECPGNESREAGMLGWALKKLQDLAGWEVAREIP